MMKRSIFILFLMLQWTSSCYGDVYSDEPSNKYADMSIVEDDSDSEGIEELTFPTEIYESVTETNPPKITQTPTTVEEKFTPTSSIILKIIGSESTEALIAREAEGSRSKEAEASRTSEVSSSRISEISSSKSEEAKASRTEKEKSSATNEDESPQLKETTVIPETSTEGNSSSIKAPGVASVAISLRKATSKSIKPRLLETNPEEVLTKQDRKDGETVEVDLEDTTPLSELEVENNATNNEDTEEDETTVQPATIKKSKKIEIYKTRPNELLRHYVEDSHLRSPVAALIDKKANPLAKSKKLWKAALRPNALLDIMVVSYDYEGIKSTYNLTNTRAMMSTLDRVKEDNATTQESKTYYSIIRTGQLIPYDSAIFLSTDKLPNDTEHQQPASMILLKKRIRLYLVIFDEKNHVLKGNSTTVVRQTGFLGQLALRTGGDVIYVPNHAFRADGEMGLITLVVGNRFKPIDSELKEVYENELKSENTETVGENEETTSIH